MTTFEAASLFMGHEHCGAVKASVDDVKLGNITAMLTKIRPAVEMADDYEGEKTNLLIVSAGVFIQPEVFFYYYKACPHDHQNDYTDRVSLNRFRILNKHQFSDCA